MGGVSYGTLEYPVAVLAQLCYKVFGLLTGLKKPQCSASHFWSVQKLNSVLDGIVMSARTWGVAEPPVALLFMYDSELPKQLFVFSFPFSWMIYAKTY